MILAAHSESNMQLSGDSCLEDVSKLQLSGDSCLRIVRTTVELLVICHAQAYYRSYRRAALNHCSSGQGEHEPLHGATGMQSPREQCTVSETIILT